MYKYILAHPELKRKFEKPNTDTILRPSVDSSLHHVVVSLSSFIENCGAVFCITILNFIKSK